MKRIGYVLLGLAGLFFLLLAVLWQLPAQWLADEIHHRSGGECRLSRASGTVWDGEADAYLLEHQHSAWQRLGRLHWRSDASALISGTWRLIAELDGGRLVWTMGLSERQADGEGIKIPAAVVLGRLGNGMPISGWGGWFIVNKGSWHEDKSGASRLDVDLSWKQAAAQIFQDAVLGDYRLQGQLVNGQGRLQLSTEMGNLKLDGHVDVGASVRFSGLASVPPNSPLETSLQRVATPDGAGVYRLTMPPL